MFNENEKSEQNLFEIWIFWSKKKLFSFGVWYVVGVYYQTHNFQFFSLFYLTSLNLFLFSLVLSFKYFFTRQKVPCSHWSFGSPISLRFLYWVSEQICDHDIALDRNPSLFTAFFRGCRNSRYCWLSSWVVVIYQFFFASTCTFAFSLYSNQLNWIKRFIKFILYSVCFKCLISKQLN